MEAARDAFAFIVHLCQVTSSQETRLLNCPFAVSRESEFFPDSTPNPFSTASEQTVIVMVSPPESDNDSVHQKEQLEDDVVFHTPPEEHPVQSSDDQNLDELRAEERRGLKRVRVSQNDDKDEFEKCKDGGTGDTEPIEVERNGAFAHEDTEVISDSGEVAATVNLAEDCDVLVQKIVHGNDDESRKRLNKCERNCNENASGLSRGSLASHKIEEEIVKVEHTVGKRSCNQTRKDEIQFGGRSEGDEKKKGTKKIGEIDGFGYKNVGKSGKMRRKLPLSMNEIEKKVGETMERELPLSMKGKEKTVGETLESEKIGIMGDFSDVLKVVLGDHVDAAGYEADVDFLETAKKRGLKFPRPRYWLPSDGVDER